MKYFPILLSACLLGSCADDDIVQLTPNEPDDIAAYDYLKDYGTLSSYADFNVGVKMDASAFLDNGVDLRIAASNFNEILPGTAFSHASTAKANGRIDTATVISVIDRAKELNMSLFGYPLIGNTNQNSTYLSSKLEPNVIRPDGDDGGYALKITNTVMCDNASDAQVAYTFARTPAVEPTIKYKLTFMVRGTAEGTVQCATYSNGRGSRFTPAFKVTKEWTKVSMTNNMASGITGLQSILFNVGQYIGTMYVDDIELYELDDWDYEATDNLNTLNTDLDDAETTVASISIQTASDGLEEAGISALGEGYDPLATYTEKTDEEKLAIMQDEMNHYLSSVITTANDYVTEWAVVCNPLDSTSVATSDGKTLGSGEFYWADYMGKDYAVNAFKTAAQYADATDKLYICESGMESNADKCDALLSYVTYLEGQGARIDGIGTSINVSTTTADCDLISSMFSKLAATGKAVKITGLTVGIGDNVPTDSISEAQYVEQSDLYQYIITTYRQQVPAAQQAGIIQSTILDTSDSPVGLWNRQYSRKHAYGGFAKGLVSD